MFSSWDDPEFDHSPLAIAPVNQPNSGGGDSIASDQTSPLGIETFAGGALAIESYVSNWFVISVINKSGTRIVLSVSDNARSCPRFLLQLRCKGFKVFGILLVTESRS